MIDLPKFKIGNLEMNLIQGGMGVGVSGKNLASAVANCGGAGIIASVGLGKLKGYSGRYADANQEALRAEIRGAREMSDGVIGANILHAVTDYEKLVRASIEEGVDLIICGAGIPSDLPLLAGDSSARLVPIVSDVRVARIITRAWKRYGRVPDAFIVEGPRAGGHLGFSYDSLVNGTAPSLEDISKEVIDFANDPKNFGEPVPVVVAGGIYTGKDIAHYQGLGAAGVQMATRFVTTRECDAADAFKRMYLNATPEDIVIIKSPVGMPGRAIRNPFLDRVMAGERTNFKCGFNCLKTCEPKESPYCIAVALAGAQQGNFNEGFAFAGANAYRATPESCLDENGEFISVRTLMERLSDEYPSVA
ncbi:MAG: nitronate monooxygenase family protein [archaeon]|nr:nitronate monooxygenase family protein [archaeon]MCR4323364.1 nitronate monooxygenase family protein [Nanoarchaeota archaeon]